MQRRNRNAGLFGNRGVGHAGGAHPGYHGPLRHGADARPVETGDRDHSHTATSAIATPATPPAMRKPITAFTMRATRRISRRR